jgi:hypothetical protein
LQKGNYKMERRQDAAMRTGEPSRAVEGFARFGAQQFDQLFFLH